MESSYFRDMTPILAVFLLFFLLFTPVFPTTNLKDFRHINTTFQPNKQLSKATMKTIKSPDGDIIDCVLIHFQPAFNNPMLKVTKPLDPPEIPNGNKKGGMEKKVKQLWSSKGKSCPHGTIPIRRQTESEILASDSISTFKKTLSRKDFNYSNDGHQHAVAYVTDGEFYGAKASLNVWAPNVTRPFDFSLSQIWVIADVPTHGLSTLEAGWQVAPAMYGNKLPRFFLYWTNDGYRSGCYNLLCSGFVQTTHEICLGATFDALSTYNGTQYDFDVLIWKDPRHGNWWLRVGTIIVGYWPVALFPDFSKHATAIEYGGEVFNAQSPGQQPTSTIMGSGHFATEGFGKASFVRNMEIVDEHNVLQSVGDVNLLTEKPNCYDIKNGFNSFWGYYIFFGGPGNNPHCT
ncbi:uncharacterized protein LOC111893822 [Lactuca sativa]|uniref:Neprosin PEP catalytic domain-containing protein n=1 Tax=Lactuca sativa TaxID=4236 RepID=A0A9R1USY0_LACSA|nr:uncharacterized protein LOC111893822 [Lactuca sativa]KAJ0192719.1 hypothetical protein LSAT_V11C800450440 [Lactuca sativa]